MLEKQTCHEYDNCIETCNIQRFIFVCSEVAQAWIQYMIWQRSYAFITAVKGLNLVSENLCVHIEWKITHIYSENSSSIMVTTASLSLHRKQTWNLKPWRWSRELWEWVLQIFNRRQCKHCTFPFTVGTSIHNRKQPSATGSVAQTLLKSSQDVIHH